MNTVVYKFGGSSLANKEKLFRAAALLQQARQRGEQVLCVVSAQGSETDALLRAAASVCKTANKRELDALLATGEQKSAALLAIALCSMGIAAQSLTAGQAGILCSGAHGEARIRAVDAARLKALLHNGVLPVITGFQGVNEAGDVCTLGRGGSDATACAVAAALQARCVICTDVNGIFSADPRVLPQAKQLPKLSREDALALAANGAGVLMDRSAQLAAKYALPLTVQSCNAAEQGTELCGSADESPAFCGVSLQTGLQVGCSARAEALPQLIHSAEQLDGSFLHAVCEADTAALTFFLQNGSRSAVKALGCCSKLQVIPAAKVCLVGSGALCSGTAERFVRCLQEEGIAVYAVCQSANSIWASVDEQVKNAALCAVHGEFIT